MSVDSNLKKLTPKKPPLVKGMVLSVRLSAKSQTFVLIPRKAIHQNEIYLIDKDQKLQRQNFRADYYVGDFALRSVRAVESLIKRELITSDVFPAVAGQHVFTQPDQTIEAQLAEFAEKHR